MYSVKGGGSGRGSSWIRSSAYLTFSCLVLITPFVDALAIDVYMTFSVFNVAIGLKASKIESTSRRGMVVARNSSAGRRSQFGANDGSMLLRVRRYLPWRADRAT